MPRWLLSLLAVLSLLAASVTTYASAGLVGEAACCCPEPATCKCHDHDGTPDASPSLQRCGGEAELVDPTVAPTLTPAVPEIAAGALVPVACPRRDRPIPESRTIEPETPPF